MHIFAGTRFLLQGRLLEGATIVNFEYLAIPVKCPGSIRRVACGARYAACSCGTPLPEATGQ